MADYFEQFSIVDWAVCSVALVLIIYFLKKIWDTDDSGQGGPRKLNNPFLFPAIMFLMFLTANSPLGRGTHDALTSWWDDLIQTQTEAEVTKETDIPSTGSSQDAKKATPTPLRVEGKTPSAWMVCLVGIIILIILQTVIPVKEGEKRQGTIAVPIVLILLAGFVIQPWSGDSKERGEMVSNLIDTVKTLESDTALPKTEANETPPKTEANETPLVQHTWDSNYRILRITYDSPGRGVMYSTSSDDGVWSEYKFMEEENFIKPPSDAKLLRYATASISPKNGDSEFSNQMEVNLD